MNAAQKLVEARKFSPEIAEWIDARKAAGFAPKATVKILQATVALAKAQNELVSASDCFASVAALASEGK